jgi:uncharacterized protein YbbK (DUF523 family)
LVSACLLGIRCRYDGRVLRSSLHRSGAKGSASSVARSLALVPVCPEQLAGFPTPRMPITVAQGRAKDASGRDVTAQLRRGAWAVLKIARLYGCRQACLKSRSPSCGEQGITTRLLRSKGIRVRIVD